MDKHGCRVPSSGPPPTPRARTLKGRSQQWGGPSRLSPAVATDGERDVRGGGSARRHRERRLRCVLRHERQAVAMALAEQLHHSANRVERDAAVRREPERGRSARSTRHGDRSDLSRDAAGSGSGAATTGGDPAAHGDRLRAGSRPRRAAGGWWKSLHPRPQCFKHHRLSWSLLHLRLLFKRRRLWWMVDFFARAPVVFQASSLVVESTALAPVVQAPTPVVDGGCFCTCASSVPNLACCGVSCTRASVVRIASARWIFVTCASFQGSVPGQSSTFRRRHDLPLPSGWRRADDASGRVYCWHVHTRQTR